MRTKQTSTTTRPDETTGHYADYVFVSISISTVYEQQQGFLNPKALAVVVVVSLTLTLQV